MGHMIYGTNGMAIPIEDRALAHLQLVITVKLRRRESFVFHWTDPLTDERNAIFLSDAIPLTFQYTSSVSPSISRLWLEDLNVASNGTQGLHLLKERLAASEAKPSLTSRVHA